MAVIPVTQSHLHQMRWTLSTALRGRSFLSPAILRATRSTMMGASTPSTPASNPTVYRIAWLWENRIDPNAQEQKANCQNADFHIAFLSVVCLVISFTYLDLSYKFHVYSRYLAATRDVHSTTTGCKWLICRYTTIMQRNQSAHTAWDTTKCPSDRSQIYQLTIGSYVSVRSSRYEARGKMTSSCQKMKGLHAGSCVSQVLNFCNRSKTSGWKKIVWHRKNDNFTCMLSWLFLL